MNLIALKESIKKEAGRLGFILAGFTLPDAPTHLSTYIQWVEAGYHANMHYLFDTRAIERRSNPKLILPECNSILMLATPYWNPGHTVFPQDLDKESSITIEPPVSGRIAAYAWGEDYHTVFERKLNSLVNFIEEQVGHTVPNRFYTDTGPVLERSLAQRAGLGWIGKNTCLIHPKIGSYFLLAEILLGLEITPDPPNEADHCGTCTRCIDACPTHCILPNRTLDARRCISYLTIEHRGDIPKEIRPLLGNWVFGCDVCQMVCPWNRFSPSEIDAAFSPRPGLQNPDLIQDLNLTPQTFNQKFRNNPVKRAKRRGYLRNIAIALGNSHDAKAIPSLEKARTDPETLVRDHVPWALKQIKSRFND